MTPRCLFLFVPLLFSSIALAQKSYPPKFEGATEHIYKEIDGVTLKLWEFSKEKEAGEKRPAIVFFFGGGWKSGSPKQFEPHARELAERGMVALVADYRVSSRHGTKARDCVADARDAIRFVRKNAEALGVDPERIAAGGGSAGGHIAACLGVIAKDPQSSVQALALFNPACVLAPIDGQNPWKEDRAAEMRERMGVDPRELSPAHHVSEDAPPCVIFHGKADTTVSYVTAEIFAEKMKEAGVPCVLHGYEGEGHGFFNYGRKSKGGGKSACEKTLTQLDQFLVDLGWLTAS